MTLDDIVLLRDRIINYCSQCEEHKIILLPVTISLVKSTLNMIDFNQLASLRQEDIEIFKLLLVTLEEFNQPEFKTYITILQFIIFELSL